MPTNLIAHEQPILKIFSEDYVFRIPGYQRPYAWTTEQARDLFEDLAGSMRAAGGAIEEMPPYFLGSIVLIKSEAAPDADVVDGQQRLTTLTILLSAIRATVKGSSAAEVTPLLYEKGSAIRGTKDRFRLTLRDRDQTYFQTYVQREGGFAGLLVRADPLTDSQRKIRAAALLFKERLDAMPEAERLRLAQFVVTRCYLVVVATPDLESAYRIFSVLHSRGLDLTATDILKSEVIGGVPGAHRDAYTAKWEDAEESLGRDAFGELFGHIRMIHRRAKPQGTLLKEFKEHVPSLRQPTRFIDDVLLPMSRAYQEILDGACTAAAGAEGINEHLRWLDRLELTDWIPPTLAFFTRHRQDPDGLLAFVRDVERLAYAMLVSGAGVNERIERFSRVTGEILSGADLSAAESALQLAPREQHEMVARLDGDFYELLPARARTTILLRLNALLSAGEATYGYDVITVEHVLPRNPAAGSTWVQWFPDPAVRTGWVHRIGNLALLPHRKDSAASSLDFAAKKQSYLARNGASPFVLTTQVLHTVDWTPTVVAQRQAQLMGVLEQHWRLRDGRSAAH